MFYLRIYYVMIQTHKSSKIAFIIKVFDIYFFTYHTFSISR